MIGKKVERKEKKDCNYNLFIVIVETHVIDGTEMKLERKRELNKQERNAIKFLYADLCKGRPTPELFKQIKSNFTKAANIEKAQTQNNHDQSTRD